MNAVEILERSKEFQGDALKRENFNIELIAAEKIKRKKTILSLERDIQHLEDAIKVLKEK